MKMEFLFYNIVSITKVIQCEKRQMSKMKATCFMDIMDFYRGADKSLARPGRKQAAVTKL